MTDLDTAKQNAQMLISSTADRIRALFVGPIGTTLLYLEEIEEAADYVAAGSPVDASNYPHIEIETTITGQTAASVASKILAKKTLWITNSVRIKGIYLTALADLANATTPEQVQTISDNVVTTLTAISP